jgi:hypothetical protein
MGDDLQGKIDGRYAGMALAKTVVLIGHQMAVKSTEHFGYLLVQRLQIRRFSVFVKENGIPFNFRYFQPDLVGIDQDFQQFLDDMPAMVNLGFVDKPGEATDIRDKKQAFIFHVPCPVWPGFSPPQAVYMPGLS